MYRLDEDEDALDRRFDAPLHYSELFARVKAKQTPRRAQFELPFELAPNFTIGIKGFILLKRQEIRPATWVYAKGEKPEIVRPEVTYVCAVSCFVILLSCMLI